MKANADWARATDSCLQRNNARLGGVMRWDEAMSRHTLWGVGGLAKRFYIPSDARDLCLFLRSHPLEEPLLWLGLGSNLLVRDGGFQGTVIRFANALDGLTTRGRGQVRVEAGVSCAKLARFCAHHGLSGAEFLAGIPGTLGGALAMNAGAFGSEVWDFVLEVETLDQQGVWRVRTPEAYHIGYREVRGAPGEWFAAAQLQFESGTPAQVEARMRALVRRRDARQPIGQRSCGSVFRNPPGDYAGRLIEASGLKGSTVGGAMVSTTHANFIVNTGYAQAADIEALMSQITRTVRQQHGIKLVPEVHIVGEP